MLHDYTSNEVKTFFKLEISSADIKTHYYMLHAKKKKKSTFVLLNKKKANVKAQLPKQHKT